MEKTYKYSTQIARFNNCPPVHCKEINSNAFRFIFEKLDHPNNFIPVLLISPARINDRMFDNDEMKCYGYSLSLFDRLINAKKYFLNQINRNPEFANKVGAVIAEIEIEQGEGIATKPSIKEKNLGHFEYFEHRSTDFSKKIKNIEKLIL